MQRKACSLLCRSSLIVCPRPTNYPQKRRQHHGKPNAGDQTTAAVLAACLSSRDMLDQAALDVQEPSHNRSQELAALSSSDGALLEAEALQAVMSQLVQEPSNLTIPDDPARVDNSMTLPASKADMQVTKSGTLDDLDLIADASSSDSPDPTPNRSRRRRIPTTSAGENFTTSAREHRLLRRRLTNQRSAQRMREKRQEEIGRLQAQVECMSEENDHLQRDIRKLEEAYAGLSSELASWQARWKITAANNVDLYQQLLRMPCRTASLPLPDAPQASDDQERSSHAALRSPTPNMLQARASMRRAGSAKLVEAPHANDMIPASHLEPNTMHLRRAQSSTIPAAAAHLAFDPFEGHTMDWWPGQT